MGETPRRATEEEQTDMLDVASQLFPGARDPAEMSLCEKRGGKSYIGFRLDLRITSQTSCPIYLHNQTDTITL